MCDSALPRLQPASRALLRLELGNLQTCQEMNDPLIRLYPSLYLCPVGLRPASVQDTISNIYPCYVQTYHSVPIFYSVCPCWGQPVPVALAYVFLCQISVTDSWGIAHHQFVCHLQTMDIYQTSGAPESDLPSR